jgi:hypothetical protein
MRMIFYVHYNQVFLKKSFLHILSLYKKKIHLSFKFAFLLQKRKGKAKSIFQVLAFDKNICFSIFIKKKQKTKKCLCIRIQT